MDLNEIILKTGRNDVAGLVNNVSNQISQLSRLAESSDDSKILDKIKRLEKYAQFHDADYAYFGGFDDGYLIMVCDGVSLGNGKLASQLINDFMEKKGSINDEASLIKAIADLNTILFENDAASTLTASIVKGDEAAVYNIGDSKSLHFSSGKLANVTDDMGRLYISENMVSTNFLGSRKTAELDLDLTSGSRNLGRSYLKLKDGDLIILATDGYYEVEPGDMSTLNFMKKILQENARKYRRAKNWLRPEMIIKDLESYATVSMNNDDRAIVIAEARLDNGANGRAAYLKDFFSRLRK